MSKPKDDNQNQQIVKELTIMDSLLRNDAFAVAIGESQNMAYHVGVGKTPTPFLSPKVGTASVEIKTKDEKVAINLAGFYALECGIGALCAQTNQKPTDLLQTIVENNIDATTVLLLNRFANATWKAGQPFRGLDRIKRPAFTVASFLPAKEVKKDYGQIQAASGMLLTSMQDVRDRSTEDQMKKLRSLLQDEKFAVEMAAFLDATYYTAQKKSAPPFLSDEDQKTIITKHINDQKIATKLAGFYALECGLNYLVTTQQKLPSNILRAIIDHKISKEDKQLLCRFADATWKAGQPFKGLDRITRATFTPFYFLTESDTEKHWVQVKAAAGEVLKKL